MQQNSHRLLILLAVTGSCLLTGCGNGNKEVSFKSGGMTHTLAEGQGSIPGNFPLPLYPKAEATGSVSAQDDQSKEDSKFLILSSSDSLDKVSRFYQDSMKSDGWSIEHLQTLPSLVNISGRKGDLESNVMLSTDGKNTTISLSASHEGDKETASSSESFSVNKVTPPTD